MSSDTSAAETRAAIKVTLIGSVLDLALGILKILAGLAANSVALVSDGIHSLSDLVTDAFVLLITRYSNEAPDAEHPYGHARFETIGTIVLGMVLFGVAGAIFYDAIRRLLEDNTMPVPGWLALVITVISIGSKEWIFRYTRKVAVANGSSLLLANAWHSRTDAFSSIAVLVGVIGAMLGYGWMDLLAAIVVALMIAHIAWNLVFSSVKELVDTALPESKLKEIRQSILKQDGIIDAHSLRSRLLGGKVFLDIHAEVHSDLTVSEGHYLAETLEARLIAEFTDVDDVVVHIDPEVDMDHYNLDLPLRAEVEKSLHACWQTLENYPQIKAGIRKTALHYLNNEITVDLYVDKTITSANLPDQLNGSVQGLEWLTRIRVFTELSK